MSTKPLDQTSRDKLAALLQKKTGQKVAKSWGIDRGTLAEAALGLPKQASVRYLIEGKLKELS